MPVEQCTALSGYVHVPQAYRRAPASQAVGHGHGRQRGAFGREPSGDGDVVPDELLSGVRVGGYGGGLGDEGDDHVGARGGLVGRSSGRVHHVGVVAGDGVGEGELEEAFGVGRGSGHVQVFGGVRLVEGEGHGRHPGA